MSLNPGSWVKDFLLEENSYKAQRPLVVNRNPDGFTYPAGEAPFELLFRHNPILYSLLPLLPTPSIVSMFFVSKSTRSLLGDMTPFFRNLAFVPESNPVKWIHNTAVHRTSKDVPNPLQRAFVDFQKRREREKVNVKEAEEMIGRYLSDTLDGTSLVSQQIFTEKYESARYHFYRRLRGRHLCRMIETFPVGRRLTTLIIDGSGVDTDSLKLILSKVEGTLRGVSAKWCRHIECYMWSEWILEAMYKSTPFALQWLNIYGSGNTPISDFRWDKNPDQLTPLRRHRNDLKIPGALPAAPSHWKPKPNLLANLIPFDVHYDHTMALLVPQNLNNFNQGGFLHANRQAIGLQREIFMRSHPRPALWDPPENSTLHDTHPLISLLSVAKFRNIELDISYCMNGGRCYSFLYSRPEFVGVSRAHPGDLYGVTVFDTLNGIPDRFTPASEVWGEGLGLHTHCVAEAGKRREDGGGACVNCGMWEDRLAESEHRGTTPVRNVGGILTGDSIGIGRVSVGNLCLECTTNMTCVSCNAFYCNSCLFRSVPPLPRIPTAVELPDPEFLQMICSRNIHGPYCRDCVEMRTDTCVDCDERVCTGCLAPDGLSISTNTFGGTLDLASSYGVIYHAQQERSGNCAGWDEALFEDGDAMPHCFETDNDSEGDGDISSGESPGHYRDEDREGSLVCTHQLSMGSGSGGEEPAGSSSSSTYCSPSSFRGHWGTEDSPELDRGSEPNCFPLPLRFRQMIHDPRIILSTRVTEKCDGCEDLLCSFCLNYDANLGTDLYEATEYQSCAGGCGLRICKPCLHGEEFVRVWCYEKCGAWLCFLCTNGRRDVAFMCHPGARGERWGWGRGEFLPFMWWTCRYRGHLDCNSENED